jgi:hypothetical protein
MVVVVVLEPPRKLRQDRLCIRAIMNVNIITLERCDERLGHTVRLRRSYGRKARHEADRLREGDGVVGAVTATVIREPLHRMRGLLIVKASLDALEHEIADHLAGDTAGCGVPGHHLAIASVECEGDTNALAVPAGDLEAIRGPAQVRADRDDLPVVGSSRRLSGIALQQKAILRHQAVNAFVVEPGKSCALTLSVKQRPDPTIPVRRPIIRQRSDGRQDLSILLLLLSPSRATPFAKTRVKLRVRDAKRIGNRLHSEPSSGNDGNREISFFRAQPSQPLEGSRSLRSSCPRLARVPRCASQAL